MSDRIETVRTATIDFTYNPELSPAANRALFESLFDDAMLELANRLDVPELHDTELLDDDDADPIDSLGLTRDELDDLDAEYGFSDYDTDYYES